MDDRSEEIFLQYDFRIKNICRARGALLLETDQGLKLYGRYHGTRSRLEYENKIKACLREQGFPNVDYVCPNKEGQLVSEDSQGELYMIRDWFQGTECSLRDKRDVAAAAAALAHIHTILSRTGIAQAAGGREQTLTEAFRKHNRELKRVRSYIMDKRQKNEFEVLFLKLFDGFFEKGRRAEELLCASHYSQLLEEVLKEGKLCHGAYNYHNIIFYGEETAVTNFNKAGMGVQILDLYAFLRKAMEKNNWNIEMGLLAIDSYRREKPVTRDELKLLYILNLYPEKFWKITNHYFNNKKSWISARNIQKLVSLQKQDSDKELFMKELWEYCYGQPV